MQGPAPCSACTASARSAWGSEAPAGPGQQLILAHQHESGPISLKQQLGRLNHLLEGLGGSPSLGSWVIRMPMLLARPAGSMRIPLVLQP